MKAKEVMTRDVVCIMPDAGIREAHAIMRDLGVRHLPVVASGRCLGILSDRDILPFTERGEVVSDRIVEEVMTESPIVADKKASISDLAGLMLEYKIDSLPVVELGKLVGLVTSTDLLMLLHDSDATETAFVPFVYNLITRRSDRPALAATA